MENATDGVTIIVFSGDMDKVMAAFNIAIGAAAIGQGDQHVLHLLGHQGYTEWQPDGKQLFRQNDGTYESRRH